ncbi:unnamed protein product [Urochloa humidicola]
MSRRRRSAVWEHYEQNLVNVDGDLKAVCKYCGLHLSTKSGTSSLRGHIANSCPAIDSSIRKRFQATLSKKASADHFVFDPQVCCEEMTKYIIHAEIPFLKFEDPYLQPWLNTLQSTFRVRDSQTMQNDCLKKYEEMKKELQVELQSLDSRVCLTSDIWTSSQNLQYMAVTAHYIDAEFKIKKKIIRFKKLEYPHTGYAIKEEIVSCWTDWEIKDKVFTFTSDDSSNNISASELLKTNYKHDLLFGGEHLHVRCCAHILNILVQDGMRVIHTTIDKLRELLRHIDSSVSRLQVFNSIANDNGLASKSGIYLDFPTQWNSTYKMLREALKYKDVLNSYALKYYYGVSLSEEEWVKAKAICLFLKTFEEFTLAVSADNQPTSHKFLHLVLCVPNALKDPAWQTTDLLKKLATSLCSKFENYWNPDEDNPCRKNKELSFNLALVIATVLDPRRKAYYLDFFFEKVCRNVDQIRMCVNSAMEWMRKYLTQYDRYRPRTRSIDTMTCASEVSTAGSLFFGKRKLEAEFAQFKSARRTSWAKSEIDLYLEEETEDDIEGFDILAWWKSKSKKFPMLSSMARDFLAIPLSTVLSESAFSCGGRILGDHRSSLTPDMLEALVCSKDWLNEDVNREGQDLESPPQEE